MTTKSLKEQLLTVKPLVKVVPVVQVRRKKSWRNDDFRYEVEFVKPTWETLDTKERVHFIDCFVKGV